MKLKWASLEDIGREFGLRCEFEVAAVRAELMAILTRLHPDKTGGTFQAPADKEFFLRAKEAMAFVDSLDPGPRLPAVQHDPDLVLLVGKTLEYQKQIQGEQRSRQAIAEAQVYIRDLYRLPRIGSAFAGCLCGILVLLFGYLDESHPVYVYTVKPAILRSARSEYAKEARNLRRMSSAIESTWRRAPSVNPRFALQAATALNEIEPASRFRVAAQRDSLFKGMDQLDGRVERLASLTYSYLHEEGNLLSDSLAVEAIRRTIGDTLRAELGKIRERVNELPDSQVEGARSRITNGLLTILLFAVLAYCGATIREWAERSWLRRLSSDRGMLLALRSVGQRFGLTSLAEFVGRGRRWGMDPLELESVLEAQLDKYVDRGLLKRSFLDLETVYEKTPAMPIAPVENR